MTNITDQMPFVSIVITTYNRKVKLARLINSLYESDYPKDRIEIIVVDDNSFDDTVTHVANTFPEVIILSSKIKLLSAAGRNVGARMAKGDYIFFIDDDNIVHGECISHLVNAFGNNHQIGMCAPIMLEYVGDKDSIWCGGATLSASGQVSYVFAGKKFSATNVPPLIFDVDFFPNFYAIRKELVQLGVEHDSTLFPHNWSEYDFSLRIKRRGYAIATVTAAITWHDIDYKTRTTRISETNAYDQPRSRILITRKYGSFVQKVYFFSFFLPVSILYYIYIFLKKPESLHLIQRYVHGLIDGLTIRVRQ